jgi:hypothetical protein
MVEEDQKREGSKFGVEMEAGSSSFYSDARWPEVCGGADMVAVFLASNGDGRGRR